MLRFNNDNIITGQIKQVLKEFNLPQVRVFNNKIRIFPGHFYIKDNNLCVGVDLNGTTSLQVIQPYLYGQNIQNLSKNLLVTDMIYDSYTHIYLGEYLRFYRDMKNINLMSMYNCFSNEQAKNIKIQTSSFNFDTENDTFKIYMVPVKFFEKYTIGIECDTKIEIVAGLYDNEKIINFSNNPEDITLYNNTYVKKVGTKISKPFIYDKLISLPVDLLTKNLYSQEKNLKIFIKVPSTSTSSIVVLEGDFIDFADLHFEEDDTFAGRKVAFEVCNFETGSSNFDGQQFVYSGANRERKYLSRPQLLDFNSTVSYPFSSRLVEYLFDNVITSDDIIAKNVSRIQKRLVQRYNEYVTDSAGNIVYLLDDSGNYVLSNGTAISISSFNSLPPTDPRKKMRLPIHKYIGMSTIINQDTMWSTKLRNVCYDAIVSSDIQTKANANKFDLIGFIDKDSEQAIGEYTEGN